MRLLHGKPCPSCTHTTRVPTFHNHQPPRPRHSHLLACKCTNEQPWAPQSDIRVAPPQQPQEPATRQPHQPKHSSGQAQSTQPQQPQAPATRHPPQTKPSAQAQPTRPGSAGHQSTQPQTAAHQNQQAGWPAGQAGQTCPTPPVPPVSLTRHTSSTSRGHTSSTSKGHTSSSLNDQQAVQAYIREEQAYTKAVLQPLLPLQRQLDAELQSSGWQQAMRLHRDRCLPVAGADETVIDLLAPRGQREEMGTPPDGEVYGQYVYRQGPSMSGDGSRRKVHLRLPLDQAAAADQTAQVILDEGLEALHSPNYTLCTLRPSPTFTHHAFTTCPDPTTITPHQQGTQFTLHVRCSETGVDVVKPVTGVTGPVTWSTCGTWVYYTDRRARRLRAVEVVQGAGRSRGMTQLAMQGAGDTYHPPMQRVVGTTQPVLQGAEDTYHPTMAAQGAVGGTQPTLQGAGDTYHPTMAAQGAVGGTQPTLQGAGDTYNPASAVQRVVGPTKQGAMQGAGDTYHPTMAVPGVVGGTQPALQGAEGSTQPALQGAVGTRADAPGAGAATLQGDVGTGDDVPGAAPTTVLSDPDHFALMLMQLQPMQPQPTQGGTAGHDREREHPAQGTQDQWRAQPPLLVCKAVDSQVHTRELWAFLPTPHSTTTTTSRSPPRPPQAHTHTTPHPAGHTAPLANGASPPHPQGHTAHQAHAHAPPHPKGQTPPLTQAHAHSPPPVEDPTPQRSQRYTWQCVFPRTPGSRLAPLLLAASPPQLLVWRWDCAAPAGQLLWCTLGAAAGQPSTTGQPPATGQPAAAAGRLSTAAAQPAAAGQPAAAAGQQSNAAQPAAAAQPLGQPTAAGRRAESAAQQAASAQSGTRQRTTGRQGGASRQPAADQRAGSRQRMASVQTDVTGQPATAGQPAATAGLQAAGQPSTGLQSGETCHTLTLLPERPGWRIVGVSLRGGHLLLTLLHIPHPSCFTQQPKDSASVPASTNSTLGSSGIGSTGTSSSSSNGTSTLGSSTGSTLGSSSGGGSSGGSTLGSSGSNSPGSSGTSSSSSSTGSTINSSTVRFEVYRLSSQGAPTETWVAGAAGPPQLLLVAQGEATLPAPAVHMSDLSWVAVPAHLIEGDSADGEAAGQEVGTASGDACGGRVAEQEAGTPSEPMAGAKGSPREVHCVEAVFSSVGLPPRIVTLILTPPPTPTPTPPLTPTPTPTPTPAYQEGTQHAGDQAPQSDDQGMMGNQQLEGQTQHTQLLASSQDGTLIPVTLTWVAKSSNAVARSGNAVARSGNAAGGTVPDGEGRPVLLDVYGAYGVQDPVEHVAYRELLLQRGWAIAVPHVRGGGGPHSLGTVGDPHWHLAGWRGAKGRGVEDVVAAAQFLVDQGWGCGGQVCLTATSAGAWLAGAAINLRPDLFRAAVLTVPPLDALTTLDSLHELGDEEEGLRGWSPLHNLPGGQAMANSMLAASGGGHALANSMVATAAAAEHGDAQALDNSMDAASGGGQALVHSMLAAVPPPPPLPASPELGGGHALANSMLAAATAPPSPEHGGAQGLTNMVAPATAAPGHGGGQALASNTGAVQGSAAQGLAPDAHDGHRTRTVFPHVMVRVALHDPRVDHMQGVRYVARLRDALRSAGQILAGHERTVVGRGQPTVVGHGQSDVAAHEQTLDVHDQAVVGHDNLMSAHDLAEAGTDKAMASCEQAAAWTGSAADSRQGQMSVTGDAVLGWRQGQVLLVTRDGGHAAFDDTAEDACMTAFLITCCS